MKQLFETPILEVIEFAQEDIIRTSIGEGIDTPTEGTGGGNKDGDLNLPIDPGIGR